MTRVARTVRVRILFALSAFALLVAAPAALAAPSNPTSSTSIATASTTTTTVRPATSTTRTTLIPGSQQPTFPPTTVATTTTTLAATTTTLAPTTTTAPAGPSLETLQRLRELEELSTRISALQYQVYLASIELDEIDKVLAGTVEEYNFRVLELQEEKQRAEALQGELELVRTELEAATELLTERMIGAYKNDDSALDFLLNTSDMSDFIRRLTLLISIVRSDKARVDEVSSLRVRADRLLDEASRQIYEVTTASHKLEEQKAAIEVKLTERQAYIDRLSEEVRGLVDQQRRIAADVAPAGFDIGSYLVGDGSAIVKTALRYLGVPYVWGGETPNGFDCSGLLVYVYRQHGLSIPHYSRYQAKLGFEVPLGAIQPGDFVAFGNPVYHIGMYIGDGLFIHAPRTGDVVKISVLAQRSDLSAIRRVAVLAPIEGLIIP
ncbi:MAG: C40 family peptidase [Actinobacteria bacterium]|nr:C40 family peptidase [Actinomycetota bacterium]